MTAAPEADGFSRLLMQPPAPPGRCPELTRTERGYERCRRDADGHTRHHVRGRAWSTGTNRPRLDLGHHCTDPACCVHPDHAVPYLGCTPKAGDRTPRAGKRS